MVKLTIDNIEVEVPQGANVLQACEMAGAEVPRFCYHERLSVAGNCRMCLVELEKAPKPIASCAMPVAEGMVIHTKTEKVKKAREGVMEFLLINHPLDCPICDQGGECDLQDQAMGYGYGASRYEEHKRAVKPKNFGPLIKTFLTRCIQCTRCVRFSAEVAGVSDLGALGRGENLEIGTYVEKTLSSELSGNMIDLCPVGALTSKPYAYAARPWELKKTNSIDVMDAVGAAIRIDSRGVEVMRVLPRIQEDINEEWISDKIRFSYDGLKRQRLDRPYIRKNGKLEASSWEEAYLHIVNRLKQQDPTRVAALAGDMVGVESLFLFTQLCDQLQIHNRDCRAHGALYDVSHPEYYLFNSKIAGIDHADACLLIGTNPRWEAPLINARLRKRWLSAAQFPIGLIGIPYELTYQYEHLGNSPDIIEKLTQKRHPFAEVLKQAERPLLIVGQAAFMRSDSEDMFAHILNLVEHLGIVKEDWHGFNMLHTAASHVGGIQVGFVPQNEGLATNEILAKFQDGEISTLYLLGADDIALQEKPKDGFIIYQGHHGDKGAHLADIILPSAAFSEQQALYVNLEGRVQETHAAIAPLGQAKIDWHIIVELAHALGCRWSVDTLAGLRNWLYKIHPQFQNTFIHQPTHEKLPKVKSGGPLSPQPFTPLIEDFYLTNSITRASKTMAECSRQFVVKDMEEKAYA